MLGDRWGVTDDEVARHYPCDDLVPAPAFAAWRGVTVRATAEQVWPWVAQIQLAPYSYDWIDNLGRRSPQRLVGLVEPVAGDHFTAAFGGRRFGTTVSVDPPTQLTGRLGGVVISYVLVDDGTTTRLLMKLVSNRWRALGPLLSVGDLAMARRQLLNLKGLAEGAPR